MYEVKNVISRHIHLNAMYRIKILFCTQFLQIKSQKNLSFFKYWKETSPYLWGRKLHIMNHCSYQKYMFTCLYFTLCHTVSFCLYLSLPFPVLSLPLSTGKKLICFTCFNVNCCILICAVEAEIEARSIFNHVHNRERKMKRTTL